MNIQQLIYVTEVHNCGSISEAARKLFMAQPNLSNAVKELEREIGITIFKRTPKGVETTKEGMELINHASDIISRMNALEEYYSQKSTNEVNISVTSMRSSMICGKLITYLNYLNKTGHPFRIHFREATNFDAINDVVNGHANFGIIRANVSNYSYFCQLAETRQCLIEPLPAEKYSVLMSSRHPLAKHEILTAEMLTPYPEIIHGDFEIPMYPYSAAYKSDEMSKNTAKKLIFVYDRASLLEIIGLSGLAYTWTTSTHPDILQCYKLIELPCENKNMEGREAIIYKKNALLSSEISKLIDILRADICRDGAYPHLNGRSI
jgi:DNA-binding transcriptional LysR family regulator